jgi:opacity protein-like surface antigen
MNRFVIFAATATAILSSSAFASEKRYVNKRKLTSITSSHTTPHNYYVSLGMGYNKSKVKITGFETTKKNNPVYSFGFGGDVDNKLRADVTLDINSKVTKKIGDIDVNYQSYIVMANMYHYFDNVDTFSPYMTGGLGFTKQKITLRSASIDSKTSKGKIGGQLGLGVSYNVTNKVMLDLGYRFVYLGKLKLKNINNVSLKSTQHKVIASIRIPF